MKIKSRKPIIGAPSLEAFDGADATCEVGILTKCSVCKIVYPEELQMTFYSEGKYQQSCPGCARLDRNLIHNFPKDKPFSGEMAKDLYDRFIEFKNTPIIQATADHKMPQIKQDDEMDKPECLDWLEGESYRKTND